MTEDEIRTEESGVNTENEKAVPEAEKALTIPAEPVSEGSDPADGNGGETASAETAAAEETVSVEETASAEESAGAEETVSVEETGTAGKTAEDKGASETEGVFPDAPVRPAAPHGTGGTANAFSPAPALPAVGCYGLTKRYGAVEALSRVSIELPAGKIIGLLGPNGSGKTTLIKILAGLLTPTEGQVRICGEEPGVSTKAMVSYLPERMYFDPGMKVKECVALFRDFYPDFDERRAVGMLSVLNVPMDRKLKTLSKGTKEKVQLVLVMSRRARLYLLDEPIGGVDPAARDFILSTIVAALDPGATVLISTHLIRDVEPVLDGFVFLGGGRCVMSGEAEAVRRESGKTLDELFREVFRCF